MFPSGSVAARRASDGEDLDLLGAGDDAEAVDAIATGVAIGGLRAGEVTALVRDRTAGREREYDADLDRENEDELVHGRPP